MKTAIIIPSRYGSTRFPGKPLAMMADKTMLQRVVEIAWKAASDYQDTRVVVATDDERIATHAHEIGADVAMTSADCPTGSDRVMEAVSTLENKPDFVVNLQGDAPLTPPEFVKSLLDHYAADQDTEIVTPVIQLDWSELDKMRHNKKTTPFTGTTAVLDRNNYAVWFSKNIIPAIRKEEDVRKEMVISPVFQHIGLYGYRHDILEEYVHLRPSRYEELEGLEQLRALEHGFKIKAIPVMHRHGQASLGGVDSPEDVTRVEDYIAQHGELVG